MKVSFYEKPSVRPRPSPPSWLRQVLLVLGKDWAIELSSGEVIITSGFFALLVVVLSSMAYFGGPRTSQTVAAGALWLSVSFALVLSLGKNWARERQGHALAGLLLTPLAPSALFAGKALGLILFLFLVEAVVTPLTILFFSIDLIEVGLGLLFIALAVTPGIAAFGTLFGALLVRTRARDLALSIVIFPLLAPALLTAIAATRALLTKAPLSELSGYLTLLALFDVIAWGGGLGMFGKLVED